MKEVIFFLLFSPIQLFSQELTKVVRKIDKEAYYRNCKIIGDTVVYNLTYKTDSTGEMVGQRDDCYIVKCDFGNPPPNSDQIIRWILCDGVPNKYNEWKVEYKESGAFLGDNPVYFSTIHFICPDHKSLLPKYTFNIEKTLHGIKIMKNKDTTDKYFGIYYKK